jgi:hypothetical protein
VLTEPINSRMVGNPQVIQLGIVRIRPDKSACKRISNSAAQHRPARRH